MKKIIAFTMILSMVAIVAGCKNQNGVCRWSPFKKDQTVCYTPCNSCDIPVVDDCFSCGTTPVVSDCSSCSVGTPTVISAPSTPVIEPIPGA